MIQLRILGSLGSLAWLAMAVAAPARTLAEGESDLLAGAAALVAVVGLALANRWVLGVAAMLALATLVFISPSAPLAAGLGLAAVVVLDAAVADWRFGHFRKRLAESTVQQALAAHIRHLPGPLVVLALTLAAVVAAPLVVAQLVGGAISNSLEAEGAAGLVLPGLLVLLVPLALGARRQRA